MQAPADEPAQPRVRETAAHPRKPPDVGATGRVDRRPNWPAPDGGVWNGPKLMRWAIQRMSHAAIARSTAGATVLAEKYIGDNGRPALVWLNSP